MFTYQVYLEDSKEAQARHQKSLKMLSDEVSQIQEVRAKILKSVPTFLRLDVFRTCVLIVLYCVKVRYCLKNLREQMAAKSHRTDHKVRQDNTSICIYTAFILYKS